MSTGRPWRTVNEARALENLPRIDDPELDTVAPQQGGPAQFGTHSTDSPVTDDSQAAVAEVLQSARARHTARLEKLDATERPDGLIASKARWHREVIADLTPIVGEEQAWTRAQAAYARLLGDLTTEAEHA
jgi:hypothetical protein